MIIDVWGASQTTIRQTISPEGSILVDNLGPIYLSGMTVREANNAVRREFAKIYAGISGPNPNTSVDLTLGNIRTIQISIMGEVAVPVLMRSRHSLLYSMLSIVPVVLIRSVVYVVLKLCVTAKK